MKAEVRSCRIYEAFLFCIMTYKIYTNKGDEIEFYQVEDCIMIEIGDGDTSEIASLSKDEAMDLVRGLNSLLSNIG